MQPFRTILFAADFSENSQDAFRTACSLAVEDKNRLFVVHVVEPDWVAKAPHYLGQWVVPPSETESLDEFLQRHMGEVYVPTHPLDVQYRTTEGIAPEEILRLAEEIGADLIVMGTHGRTGLRRLLAGSVAVDVLRRARCPVLALRSHDRPRTAEEIRVILHPTDSSDGSGAALQVARSLARDRGARLVLLHVVPLPTFPSDVAEPVDPQAYRAVMEAVRAHLDGPDLKYPVETQLRQGDAANVILHLAQEVGSDLIVMGTQARTGLGRLLLGSVAESVLAKADCPVMVVKAPRRATARSRSGDKTVVSVP
jgi:nucleotide-binding universal stress UspA family protein